MIAAELLPVFLRGSAEVGAGLCVPVCREQGTASLRRRSPYTGCAGTSPWAWEQRAGRLQRVVAETGRVSSDTDSHN